MTGFALTNYKAEVLYLKCTRVPAGYFFKMVVVNSVKVGFLMQCLRVYISNGLS